uniref:MYND-type domain-containing protein n=1 Tax=Tetradesmus obliquus TaxID=3088 RepID=A0A383VND6_TETOB|eukprot:jgi/Sobl393_1/12803/SZX66244.1
MQQQMQQLGQALAAALPLPYCCNNPGCSCCEQLSELKLVQRAASRCSGCSVARYCSRACQLAHWQQHKPACKQLAAAAKAAGKTAAKAAGTAATKSSASF